MDNPSKKKPPGGPPGDPNLPPTPPGSDSGLPWELPLPGDEPPPVPTFGPAGLPSWLDMDLGQEQLSQWEADLKQRESQADVALPEPPPAPPARSPLDDLEPVSTHELDVTPAPPTPPTVPAAALDERPSGFDLGDLPEPPAAAAVPEPGPAEPPAAPPPAAAALPVPDDLDLPPDLPPDLLAETPEPPAAAEPPDSVVDLDLPAPATPAPESAAAPEPAAEDDDWPSLPEPPPEEYLPAAAAGPADTPTAPELADLDYPPVTAPMLELPEVPDFPDPFVTPAPGAPPPPKEPGTTLAATDPLLHLPALPGFPVPGEEAPPEWLPPEAAAPAGPLANFQDLPELPAEGAPRPGPDLGAIPLPSDWDLQVTPAAPAAEAPALPVPAGPAAPQGPPSRVLDDLIAAIDTEAPAGDDLHAPMPEVRKPTAGPAEEQLVIFSLAGVDYAVPIANVQEVGRLPGVTPVPNVPPWVTGVANVRGDIISMVDLRGFLGLGPAEGTQAKRMLVVRARREELTAGLIVDQVRGMRYLPTEYVTPTGGPVEERLTPYLRGFTEYDGRLLVLLDLNRLLLSNEMRQFEPA